MFEDDSKYYRTSLLSPETIRWINKKQSNNSNSVKAYLFPPLVLQIYEMLSDLEVEFINNERIAELYSVVKFVVELYDLEHTVKKDPNISPDAAELEFLNGYVGSDRSGGTEFAEYLALNFDRNEVGVAVVGDDGELVNKKGDLQELKMRQMRLHAAFDELCNFIRRRRIDRKLSDSAVSDVEKYNAMVELFGINYFKTNAFESSVAKQNTDRSKKYPNLVVEKSGMRNYKKEGNAELCKQRRAEVSRVRGAAAEVEQRSAIRRDPRILEKTLQFWEDKGELLPLRKRK